MHGHARGPTAADADVVGKRIGAAVVDSIIGFVLYVVLSGLILGGGVSSGSVVMAMFVLPFTVFVGYYIVFEGLVGNATPGKRLFDIEVVREDGGPIGGEEAVVRNLLRFVDGMFYYAVGFLFMASSDRKQRLGDRIASTVVVASAVGHGGPAGRPHGHARGRQQGTNQPRYDPPQGSDSHGSRTAQADTRRRNRGQRRDGRSPSSQHGNGDPNGPRRTGDSHRRHGAGDQRQGDQPPEPQPQGQLSETRPQSQPSETPSQGQLSETRSHGRAGDPTSTGQ